MLEELLVPWWKILLYMLGLIATLVVIRIVIKFDVNQWQKDRREAKARKDGEKVVTQCGHVWTLYPHSEFSQCNVCLALIKTLTLLFAKTHAYGSQAHNRGYPYGDYYKAGFGNSSGELRWR